jgi:hypothetical protein
MPFFQLRLASRYEPLSDAAGKWLLSNIFHQPFSHPAVAVILVPALLNMRSLKYLSSLFHHYLVFHAENVPSAFPAHAVACHVSAYFNYERLFLLLLFTI